MTAATATLVHTSSREADNGLRIARVAAAGRVAAERQRADRQRAAWLAQGQRFAEGPGDADFCYICGRCTDHLGEHSEAQIAAWQATRW